MALSGLVVLVLTAAVSFSAPAETQYSPVVGSRMVACEARDAAKVLTEQLDSDLSADRVRYAVTTIPFGTAEFNTAVQVEIECGLQNNVCDIESTLLPELRVSGGPRGLGASQSYGELNNTRLRGNTVTFTQRDNASSLGIIFTQRPQVEVVRQSIHQDSRSYETASYDGKWITRVDVGYFYLYPADMSFGQLPLNIRVRTEHRCRTDRNANACIAEASVVVFVPYNEVIKEDEPEECPYTPPVS
jgi:hypothetical protein